MTDKTPKQFLFKTPTRLHADTPDIDRNSQDEDSRGNIQVICRFRPFNNKEKEILEKPCMDIGLNLKSVRVISPNEGMSPSFNFDMVFPSNSLQVEVYETAARPIVESVLEGFNGTVLAYGQTSSGKTYTMFGPNIDDPSSRGIIPRMVKTVFDHIDNADSHLEFAVKVGYCEIYLEKIRDLLSPGKNDLRILEDKNRGIFIEDLTEEYVSSESEVYQLMKSGGLNREVGATNMNEGSSRSHAIFIMTITQNNSTDLSAKTGKLYLVDLAGSEKISKTGAEGKRLDEAKKINLSLTTLGLVIFSLTDGKSTHIPYRDSKLTRILQESLGGNSKTSLILTCSPSSYNEHETLSTLRFGIRAKAIKNKPKINREFTVAELKLMLSQTKEEMQLKDAKILALEKRLGENPSDGSTASEDKVFIDFQELQQELETERQNLAEEMEKNLSLRLDLNSQASKNQSLMKENEELNNKLMSILFSMQSIEDKSQDNEELIDKLNMKTELLKKTIENLTEISSNKDQRIIELETEIQEQTGKTVPLTVKNDLIQELNELKQRYELQEGQLKSNYDRILQECNEANNKADL